VTLSILDTAVSQIVEKLNQNGMLDNTLVIFASDNGGCIYNGGRNAPLRGSKASLYEGGTHVDAFIYSPTLLKDYSGVNYNNLFHVSDWFPTILDMASITYDAPAGYALDGVSHLESIEKFNNDDYNSENPYGPREYMLYNAYTNIVSSNDVDDYGFDVWTGGIFAIRNNQYKLIHSYNGSSIVCAESDDHVYDDDTDLARVTDCKQTEAYTGSYMKELYDIINDPYETTNLYDDSSYDAIKVTSHILP
jgi:arylsulfatase A-like enzyme